MPHESHTVPRFVTLPGHPKAPCVLDRKEGRIALVATDEGAEAAADWLNGEGIAADYPWRAL